jgi:dTDP-4-amino-4,6-dideoxygalactose transaminase
MIKKIPFSRPTRTGDEEKFVLEAIEQNKLSGDGRFSKICQEWLENFTKTKKALLTPSCTHALEMSAILLNIQQGDEIIMPSFTFVSTPNSFVLRGAKIRFVDIRPDTLNIDENLIEEAITPNSKAIVPVHYAGVGCEMDTILDIAKKYSLSVVEDSAQGMMATYKDKVLGSLGDFGAYSFHETKNYTSGGEGGALLINNREYVDRAEVIREKGTDRSRFFRGEVDKYSWIDLGSSYLPSELQSAYLYSQLLNAKKINEKRLSLWKNYYESLKELEMKGDITLPTIPKECKHNGHIFYIKVENLYVRKRVLNHLKSNGILSTFHYVPLHSSKAGRRFGEFVGEDRFTTMESERLIRLPMFDSLSDIEQRKVIDCVFGFYR